MIRTCLRPWIKRLAIPALGALIVFGITSSLAKHGTLMLSAASKLAIEGLALSLALSLMYRVVNAAGWSLTLRALREPVGTVASVRVWLASEACRWIPGSLWSFGSRAVLAGRLGVRRPVAAASVVLELAVTVLAWLLVALLGWGQLHVPEGFVPASAGAGALALAAFGTFAALVLAAMALRRSDHFRTRIDGLWTKLRELRSAKLNHGALASALGFYVLMGLLNGLALFAIVRAVPGTGACSLRAIIAANAIAWLAGFFAIFAPGGLVVREGCLAALLLPCMNWEQAIAVALGWRLIQVVAEIVCFLIVAAWGLPRAVVSNVDAKPAEALTPQPMLES